MTKIDMRPTIIAKSDQLNADDLIGDEGRVILITRVTVTDRAEQPCVINYEGDKGKPWKPSKSMCRVLIHAWGDDGANYVGKRLTLYRDQSVKWAGAEVGGIRISHMEGLTENKTMPLTMSRGSKKPFTVKPLVVNTPPQDTGEAITDDDFYEWTTKMDKADTPDALEVVGQAIGQVTSKYNQESRVLIKAYYSDRLRHLKDQQPADDEKFPADY